MKRSNLKELTPDRNLVAACGLYCGACRSFLSGTCPGCRENIKAGWCKIRSCCKENSLQSCAECTTIGLKECRKYHSMISKIIGVVFNSDRSACIERIKAVGYEHFAAEMVAKRKHTLPRFIRNT